MNDNTEKKVVTRIAPSPTGHLHIGLVRTALFNFLYARKNGGTFIIRTEDTDHTRSTKESEEEILEGLAWIGLAHDQFFRTSERKAIHQKYLETLVTEDRAYLSKEKSRQTSGEMVEVVRLRNPGRTITFVDEIRGEITFNTTELGDIVVARAIDDPLYHFAVVADDFDMGVTHVIRGEEHISNTPRQILIGEALGAPRPLYAHLPLILATDRSKLSKRHGAVSLNEYRNTGYLKEAILNYLALLGWNPGTDEEFFTLSELILRFDLGGIQKGGAVFNTEKLTWFNREYMKQLPETEFKAEVMKRLPEEIQALLNEEKEEYRERLDRLLPTIRERTSVLSDISLDAEDGEYDFAFFVPEPCATMLAWKKDSSTDATLPRLNKLLGLLETLPPYPNAEEAKKTIWEYAEKEGRGEVLWPLRVALSGKEKSPNPFTLIHIIGKEEATKRVKNACDILAGA
jgi:glutamyl-tRNA synthetase